MSKHEAEVQKYKDQIALLEDDLDQAEERIANQKQAAETTNVSDSFLFLLFYYSTYYF